MTERPDIIAKIAWRILPILLLCYVAAFLDRVNIGFAALTMNHDLGFTAAQFGFGAGIFFLGYVLCELPSNLMLVRFGAPGKVQVAASRPPSPLVQSERGR